MENYLVIARKWRPQTFEEMIGQDHVSQTLHNALKSSRLHHALLFTGPRGVGKTSSARILAKNLKCPNAKNFVACNTCSTCDEIAAGSSMDVIEIDGASHNGVDAIRELRETVGYMPSQGKHKVYIVDEVHMLSVSAFNALLKTLEEPPPHVIFIFATTEPQKIPLTILSRVQRFDFRRIPTRLLVERLELICKKEDVSCDKESLWLIARQADGSARDSQSLLDQIITFCDGKIHRDRTVEILGLTNRQLILDTLTALLTQNTSGVLDVAKNLYESGADTKTFTQDLLEALRNTLILKLEAGQSKGLVDLPDAEIEALKEVGSQLNEEDLHFLFDMALKGSSDILRAQDPRLALEMVLLRMAQAPRIESLFSQAPARENPKPQSQTPSPKATTQTLTAPQPRQSPAEPLQNLAPTVKKKPEPIPESASPEERWSITMAAIQQQKPFLGAKLDHVALVKIENSQLHLSVSKDKQFLFDQLTQAQCLKELSEITSEIWAKPVQITFAIGANPAMTPLQNQQKKLSDEQSQIRQEVEDHPLVKNVKSHFKVQIKSITKETQ